MPLLWFEWSGNKTPVRGIVVVCLALNPKPFGLPNSEPALQSCVFCALPFEQVWLLINNYLSSPKIYQNELAIECKLEASFQLGRCAFQTVLSEVTKACCCEGRGLVAEH